MTGGSNEIHEPMYSAGIRSLAGYRAGSIPLKQLIDDLDVVWSNLEQSEVRDEFRGYWWDLEQIYASAVDHSGEANPDPDAQEDIDKAVAAIERLFDSRPRQEDIEG